jgi:hypothetical protein
MFENRDNGHEKESDHDLGRTAPRRGMAQGPSIPGESFRCVTRIVTPPDKHEERMAEARRILIDLLVRSTNGAASGRCGPGGDLI